MFVKDPRKIVYLRVLMVITNADFQYEDAILPT